MQSCAPPPPYIALADGAADAGVVAMPHPCSSSVCMPPPHPTPPPPPRVSHKRQVT